MLYPLTFHPIFKERIWGGRNLERLYGKELPPDLPVGESWEVSDRPGDESVVANGPLAGWTLRRLMERYGKDLLGSAVPAASGRFPWLVKILDARQVLSLQVHPPADRAAAMGGEPKTEMWFVAEAAPDAELFIGLKPGVTPVEFERRARDGTVAACFHRLNVRAGDAVFLPSGRVHALGAGTVIFEIQQNSDTTYRVFDWNRTDAAGRPRELHLEQSLKCIDFNDMEPACIPKQFQEQGGLRIRPLVRDALFNVDECEAAEQQTRVLPEHLLQLIGVVRGRMQVTDGRESVTLRAGQFCLLPACLRGVSVCPEPETAFLRVEDGQKVP